MDERDLEKEEMDRYDREMNEPEYFENEHGISYGTLTALTIAFGAGFVVMLALFAIYYFNTKPKLTELSELKLAATTIDELPYTDFNDSEVRPPGVEIIITPRIDRVEAFAESKPTTFGSYEPSKMLDGDPETAWSAEYAPDTDAWLKVHLREEAAVAAISLIPGFSKTTHEKYGDIFKLNHRIKDVLIEFPSGKTVNHTFQDSQLLQTIVISPPETCSEFQIVIKSVYPTEKWEDISISELEISGPE